MLKKILVTSLITLGLLAMPYVLAKDSEQKENTFKLKFNKSTQKVSLEDLGVYASISGKKGYSRHNGAAYVNLFNKFLNRDTYNFTWDLDLSEESLREIFDLETPAHAAFLFDENGLTLTEEKDAPVFDTEELLVKITNDFPKNRSYKIKEIDWEPLSDEKLQPHFDFVNILLTEGIKVTFGEEEFSFPIQTKDLIFEDTGDLAKLSISEAYTSYVLTTLDELISFPEENLVILEADKDNLSVAVTEGHVKNGIQFDRSRTIIEMQKAIEESSNKFIAITNILQGKVVNKTNLDLGPLKLIATGRTNFARSPGGRDFNIRRALNEFYNSIIIPEGETFSFNSLLGPVTYSAGWKGSYAIFGGTELKIVPGGGICQVSTTVYRAALEAGMDIIEQKSHSLYIDYYAEYGDGLDATIFPGFQDLSFINNTGAPILIEAYDDGFDAIVNFYGQDDGRLITFEGPFTASNQTDEVMENVGVLRYYELAWKKITIWADGTKEVEWLVSTYNSAVPQYKTNQ